MASILGHRTFGSFTFTPFPGNLERIAQEKKNLGASQLVDHLPVHYGLSAAAFNDMQDFLLGYATNLQNRTPSDTTTITLDTDRDEGFDVLTRYVHEVVEIAEEDGATVTGTILGFDPDFGVRRLVVDHEGILVDEGSLRLVFKDATYDENGNQIEK